VYIDAGTLDMSGGTITGNRGEAPQHSAGGVAIMNGGTASISGGTIQGNTAAASNSSSSVPGILLHYTSTLSLKDALTIDNICLLNDNHSTFSQITQTGPLTLNGPLALDLRFYDSVAVTNGQWNNVQIIKKGNGYQGTLASFRLGIGKLFQGTLQNEYTFSTTHDIDTNGYLRKK
jgi:hypothetical protein